MQQDPGFATQRPREMRDHRVDTNDQIELAKKMTERHDIGRADVACTDLRDRFGCRPSLQRTKHDAGNGEPAQQGGSHGAPLIPPANLPDQADSPTVVIDRHRRTPRRKRQVRPALDLLTPDFERMRHLHDFDVHLEVRFGCTVVESKSTIDACRALGQWQKLRLAPNRDTPRNVPKRPHETQELDRVA
ncbi:hypothetical protein [Bradyrhizobium sp. DOA9]|uniref:hypothetical protein n=1 Tax=Bradyrhizobium sp. DOA9 TaxID=1126627 RepID=UPI00046976AB|nr:hypothetical protein [Bradyrhizobium sp. DOA9]